MVERTGFPVPFVKICGTSNNWIPPINDFYLGADIGGMGSKMTVSSKGDLLNWQIEKADGTKEVIVVNKKDSNKY